MVYCEACKSWQHTVCMGYYSNKDKRLTSRGNASHACFQCLYDNELPSVIPFLGRLAAWRRALSIIFHEGLEGVVTFSRRIGLPLLTAKSMVDRMLKEGFIKKVLHNDQSIDVVRPGGLKNKWKFEVLKGQEIKKKIKSYFDIQLENYPEFMTMKSYDERRFSLKIEKKIQSTNSKNGSESKQTINITYPSNKRYPMEKTNDEIKSPFDTENIFIEPKEVSKRRKVSINEKNVKTNPSG